MSSSLRLSIDVLGNGRDLLGYPCGRSSHRRQEGVAKDAGCAREDKRLDACRYGLFEQIERAGDVAVDEVLSAMGGDMRLVYRGSVEDRLHADHTTPDARAVGYRANAIGERVLPDVETDDLVP
jgi:hypothetical protein